MAVTQAQLDWYGRLVCLPLALLLSFSLFQYLVGMYYKRRRERYVVLLLCGLGSFAALLPLSHPDKVVDRLNDVSEVLSVLTFLVQTVMIGKSVTRKVNMRPLKCLTAAAELLAYLGLVLSAKTMVEIFADMDLGDVDHVDNIMEDVAVWFIVGFRFYYLSLSRGLLETLRGRKKELALYVLFATHEYPFIALDAVTGLSWEEIQALWHRVTLGMCLLHTIHAKFKSSKSSAKRLTTASIASEGGGSVVRPADRTGSAITIGPPTVSMLRKASSSRVAPRSLAVVPAKVGAARMNTTMPGMDA